MTLDYAVKYPVSSLVRVSCHPTDLPPGYHTPQGGGSSPKVLWGGKVPP